MGLASELPGLKDDIMSLFSALYATQHVCAEYDPSTPQPDHLALEYMSGYNARVYGSALSIAIKLRSFFDIHANNPRLGQLLEEIEHNKIHGVCCTQMVPETVNLILREACNKLIHSLKTEVVMGKIESKKFKLNVLFTNEIPTEKLMIGGIKDGKEWGCIINLKSLCSQAFELCQAVEAGEFA